MGKEVGYGYIRVSTDDQVENGKSIDMQRQKIELYGQLKDIDVEVILVEEGVSGKKESRPMFNKVLEDVRRGKLQHLIFWKIDRVARDTYLFLKWYHEYFEPNQVQIHSITESIDTSTAIGRYLMRLFASNAELERETISERTRATMGTMKNMGMKVGNVPYGYRANGKVLEPDPNEQRTIQVILMCRDGGMKLRDIQEYLRVNQIENREGNTSWTISVLSKLINNYKPQEL